MPQPSRRVAKQMLVLGLLTAVMLLAACSAPPSGPQPTATAAPPTELPAPGVTQPPAAATQVAPTAAAAPLPTADAQLPTPPAQGAPDRLVIPAIELDTAIVDVGWEVVERGAQRTTEWQTADNAAGRHINSAQPGELGNVVLSGHHNTKGEVFRRISDQELALGDMVYLYDDQGRRFDYQVTEVTEPLLEVGASEAQRLANAGYIQPTSDARVTLVTCWPYWTNTHRVVVVAKLMQ
ncbi:MAG TPA: sortase [Anaerolineae bacterium]|nr:sortase [Anaerolineae bacterium]HNU02675.1 sortase [Anaerolineae bacterium]